MGAGRACRFWRVGKGRADDMLAVAVGSGAQPQLDAEFFSVRLPVRASAPCRARELVAKIFSVFVLGFRIFCVVCESRHTHARSLGAEPRPVRLYQVFLSHPVCFPFLFLYSTLSFPLYFPGETPWKSSNFGL